MTEPETAHDLDVLVVGGGPSGLFAALSVTKAGLRAELLEKGGDLVSSLCPKVRFELARNVIREAERFRLQCNHCTCLEGLGGAAFHFDTQLGYARGLSRSKIELRGTSIEAFSGLERAVGSFDRASDLIRRVYDICFAYGLPPLPEGDSESGVGAATSHFAHTDAAASYPVTVEIALTMLQAMVDDLERHGTSVRCHTAVMNIEPGRRRRWRVTARNGKTDLLYEADAVVMAVGKSALPQLRRLVEETGVRFRPARKVDIGVRLESLREDLEPVLGGCRNPKLLYLNARGEPVRTFCVCHGGRLMQYRLGDVVILDGQHCLEHPTSRTNFGIVTTVSIPEHEDGTDWALAFAGRVNAAAHGKTAVQRLGDFLGWSGDTGLPPDLRTTLIDSEWCDLRAALPAQLVADVAGMVERLNAVTPGSLAAYAIVAAPVIEKIFPELELSPEMESSAPGLYFAGDCSSKFIGITYGAASGIAAGEAIAARAESFA